jgi:hypothetical protein
VLSRKHAGDCHVKLQNQSGEYTFADALHGAHLRAIFHSMQGKVYLGKRLLLLNRTNGILHVLRLIDILRVVLHGGQAGGAGNRELWGRGRCLEREEGTLWARDSEGRVAAAGETRAEARLELFAMSRNNTIHVLVKLDLSFVSSRALVRWQWDLGLRN